MMLKFEKRFKARKRREFVKEQQAKLTSPPKRSKAEEVKVEEVKKKGAEESVKKRAEESKKKGSNDRR